MLVPVYVGLLGAESCGIIGFFTTVYSALQVMDLGLGMAIKRELARRSSDESTSAETADLVRTVEVISWTLGSAMGVAVWAGSDFLASRWLVVDQLPTSFVAQVMTLMGLTIALQWPGTFYSGGLMGLERQVRLASINGGSSLVFAGGAIALLSVSPSLLTFFAWRAMVSLITTLMQRQSLWASLPESRDARFDWHSLGGIWRFSLGVAVVSLTGIALVQLDKVIVSRSLPLDRFGAYMVASTAAAVIPQFVGPIFSARLPPLSRAVADKDSAAIERHFHSASQMIGAIVFPVSCAVAIFAQQLLAAWTRSASIAAESATVLSILAVGALLNSIMSPFYAVQLAAGWTRVIIATTSSLIVVMAPYGIFAPGRWGAVGAASTWLVLNACYVLLGSTVTLRRLLVGAVRGWIIVDVGRPLMTSAVILGAVHVVFARPEGRLGTLLVVGLATAFTIAVAVALTPEIRPVARRSSCGSNPCRHRWV